MTKNDASYKISHLIFQNYLTQLRFMTIRFLAILVSLCLVFSCKSGGGGGGSSAANGGNAFVNSQSWNNIALDDGEGEKQIASYRTAEYNANWGLAAINADRAYAILNANGRKIAGDGAKVSLVTSGAQINHAELVANYDAADSHNYMYSGINAFCGKGLYDFKGIGCDDYPLPAKDSSGALGVNDFIGTGTSMASIISGAKDGNKMHGVAFNSTLIVSDFYGYYGENNQPTGLNGHYFHEFFDSYVKDNAVSDSIMNLQLKGGYWGDVRDPNLTYVYHGYSGPFYSEYDGTVFPTAAQPSSLFLQSTLPNLISKNILLIVGTGDDADNNNDGGGDPDYLLYKHPLRPALYAATPMTAGYLLAVAAVDENLKITDKSNICGPTKDHCLVAPGQNIFGAISDTNSYEANVGDNANKYASLSGTDQASAFASAAATVLKGAWPNLTAPQISSILLKTATDLGAPGVDEIYGHGMLNLYAAVQAQGENIIVSGLSNVSSGYAMQSTSLTTNPIFGDAFSSNVSLHLAGAVFFDDYGRDYHANLASKINSPSASAAMVNNLNSIIASNYKVNVIPLSFNSSALFGGANSSGFHSASGNDLSKNNLVTNIKFQTKSYSDSRSKHLLLDNSKEDKSLTMGNGFAISQEISKETKVNFSFNIDEARNANFEKAGNFNFLSASALGSNPYQSFVSGASSAQNGNNNFSANGNVNNTTQKNFNQMMLSQKFFGNKFNLNLSQQTSYNNSSVVAKTSSKENQTSDLSFAYNSENKTNLALSFGKLNEFNNNFLNSKALGAFGNANNVNTNYVKIAAMQKVFDSNFLIIASLAEGQTKASGDANGIFRSYSDIRSRSTSVGLINEDILNGKLGIIYNEPMRVYKGSVNVNVPIGQDANGNVIRYSGNVSLVPQGRERNLELFYSAALNKKNNSRISFNFLTTKDAGNVKRQGNAYLGVVSFAMGF